ncbi:thioredoxin domain-containing protein [bacterium]|nr:thioredoxin domain-containing protein [bacterium]
MKFDKKNLAIQILALIGLGLSIKLAFIFHAANFDQYALSSFCSINDFIDCDGAAKTNTAQFLGIPLAWWGIFFYITVLFLSIVNKIKNIRFLKFLEVFKNPNSYIATLGTIAFIVSVILAFISIYKIHKLCILCFVTYFIDLTIAVIAASGLFKNIVKSFKETFFDFIDGAKKYTKTCIVLVLLATAFLTYTGISLKFVPHIKKRNEIAKYRKIKFNPYRVKGNLLGSEKADVVIELYSDYVCPLCYINNIMIHKAVQEFPNIKIIHYNYPFDKECNHYININMHPHACFMSRGAIAAGKQGNYWEMSSLLYENQPKKMEKMLELVEKLNLDKDKFVKDFESDLTTKEIAKTVLRGEELEIDATPTMYINGEQYVGVKPYYELKEILIKHGAKRK